MQDSQVKNVEPQKTSSNKEVIIWIYFKWMDVSIGHCFIYQIATKRL